MVAQFQTIEAYLLQDAKIVAFKDNLTNHEFTRTVTEYYYTPEPEPNWDGYFYMDAIPEFQMAGLFDGCVLLDEIPIEECINLD